MRGACGAAVGEVTVLFAIILIIGMALLFIGTTTLIIDGPAPHKPALIAFGACLCVLALAGWV
jgi:hypothetical protein